MQRSSCPASETSLTKSAGNQQLLGFDSQSNVMLERVGADIAAIAIIHLKNVTNSSKLVDFPKQRWIWWWIHGFRKTRGLCHVEQRQNLALQLFFGLLVAVGTCQGHDPSLNTQPYSVSFVGVFLVSICLLNHDQPYSSLIYHWKKKKKKKKKKQHEKTKDVCFFGIHFIYLLVHSHMAKPVWSHNGNQHICRCLWDRWLVLPMTGTSPDIEARQCKCRYLYVVMIHYSHI